jgi:hypothetical protein
MLRNVAGQYVAFVMVSVADGSGVTGLSPVVKVTKDGGSQTTGAGTVTELGGGQYRYAITQAETDAGVVMVLASGTGAVNAGLTVFTEDVSVARPANVTQIDGNATSGNNATLKLKQLSVVNDAGDAVLAQSTGGNGRGVNAVGHGTGSGIRGKGGATANGISGTAGDTSGAGIKATGMHGAGFSAEGADTNPGVLATGGATGNGIEANGGATSGSGVVARALGASGYGVRAVGAGNDHGISSQGAGTGAGIACTGGATGAGVAFAGGSTQGQGIIITTIDGHGVYVSASGTGKHDVEADDWGGVDVPETVESLRAEVEEIDGNTDGLEAILGGPGTQAVTLVVREPDLGPLIADADVWVSSMSGSATPVVARGRTDVEGEVTFMLEEGETYYLWAVKVGMNPIMGEAFVAG